MNPGLQKARKGKVAVGNRRSQTSEPGEELARRTGRFPQLAHPRRRVIRPVLDGFARVSQLEAAHRLDETAAPQDSTRVVRSTLSVQFSNWRNAGTRLTSVQSRMAIATRVAPASGNSTPRITAVTHVTNGTRAGSGRGGAASRQPRAGRRNHHITRPLTLRASTDRHNTLAPTRFHHPSEPI